MSQPYVGEIRLLPYVRGAPRGWHLCDGSLVAISDYEVLYTLIGTTYGGNGQSTFGLPDMRGRVPVHQGRAVTGTTYTLGQPAGTETVTLTSNQMPMHTHFMLASTVAGTSSSPANSVTATAAGVTLYAHSGDGSSPYALPPTTIGFDGGNQPHDNMGPSLALNYCISMFGIFPTQN